MTSLHAVLPRISLFFKETFPSPPQIEAIRPFTPFVTLSSSAVSLALARTYTELSNQPESPCILSCWSRSFLLLAWSVKESSFLSSFARMFFHSPSIFFLSLPAFALENTQVSVTEYLCLIAVEMNVPTCEASIEGATRGIPEMNVSD